MPDLPSPPARRLARARWLDTRFAVGVLLVLASVVLGAKVVAEANDTVAVWALARDMGPGARLAQEDLLRRDVRLDSGGERYVRADGPAPLGYVLTRPVGREELLPAGAVAAEGAASMRRLPVEVDRMSTTGLQADAVVDVYVVPEPAPGGQAPPPRSEVVVTGVTVDDVDERSGGLGAGGRTGGVVLLLGPQDAQAVLDAQARGSLRLLQVPVSPADVEQVGTS